MQEKKLQNHAIMNYNKPKIKIAVIHPCMDNIGGAEKVTLTLVEDLKADLITTNFDKEGVEKMGFYNIPVISIAKISKDVNNRLQKAFFKFMFKRLPKYDLYIVSGDWAMSALIRNKPNILYIHSPIREVWDLKETIRESKPFYHQKVLFDIYAIVYRFLNTFCVKKAKFVVCNSNNTQRRVLTYLGRDSLLIYPPVETKNLKYESTGDYWLSVNRFIDHKRIDLQLEVFRQLPNEKFIIVGSYDKLNRFDNYYERMKELKPDNVEFRTFVSDKEKYELYANCKAFISTSKDEDFGMNIIEAMAAGKPVVAVNEGGHKESVIHNKTGYLVEPNINSIIDGITKIKNPENFKEDCIAQANNFSRQQFTTEIKKLISVFQ